MYQSIEITDENIHHLPELVPVINMWRKILSIHKLTNVVTPEDIPIYLNLDYINTSKPQHQWTIEYPAVYHTPYILSFNVVTMTHMYMFLNANGAGQEIVESYHIYDIVTKINRYISNSEVGLERGLKTQFNYNELLNMTNDEFELLIRIL